MQSGLNSLWGGIDQRHNSMSTAAIFLNIEKAFDTTRHHGLLYELSELHFSPSFIILISSFFSNRKVRLMVEGELSTPWDIQAEVPQGSVLCSLYKNDTPQTPGVYLAPFVDDTCIYSTNQKKVMFIENYSSVSLQWSCGAGAGT